MKKHLPLFLFAMTAAISICTAISAFGADTARVLVPSRTESTEQGRRTYEDTVTYTLDDLTVKGRVPGFVPKEKAKLRKQFDEKLKENTVEVYTSTAIDVKIKDSRTDLEGAAAKLRGEMSASEERLSKLIVDTCQTVPTSVFEELKKQVREEVRKEMREEIDSLKARIDTLIAAFPAPAATVQPR